MAAPTFTVSNTVSKGRTGECIIEMILSVGSKGGSPVPTEGQLWPRGNS